MLDEELRKDVVGTMVREIRQRDFALIAGTQTIWRQLDLLAQYGYADETYRALVRDGAHGLKNAIRLNPLGILERFHKTEPADIASHSHATFSQIARYFHYGLGGLRPDPEQPGFKHFVLAPQVPHGLAAAGIEHESPYGLIESKWEQTDKAWTWQVRVPPNSTATVHLPYGDRAESAKLNGSTIDPVARQTLPAGNWRFVIEKTEFANQP
jgi:alpha-L-rhamnosidase